MIGTELNGPAFEVTLDRPDKRNALTPDMLAALAHAVRDDRPPESRAVLVAGRGPVFCSGFDLDLCRQSLDGSAMRALLTSLSAAVRAMRDCPLPVVLAAHGGAIAGGCALLGGADFVVTDAEARLGYPVVRLGVSPAVSAPFLRLGVGDGPCRERLLDPALITGRRAHELGLVYRCVDRTDDVLPTARTLAEGLAAKPPGALAATKRWLAQLDNELAPCAGSLDEAADAALAVSCSLTGSDEERARLEQLWDRNRTP